MVFGKKKALAWLLLACILAALVVPSDARAKQRSKHARAEKKHHNHHLTPRAVHIRAEHNNEDEDLEMFENATPQERQTYSGVGGGLVGALVGAGVGSQMKENSGDNSAAKGAALGGLAGAAVGYFGGGSLNNKAQEEKPTKAQVAVQTSTSSTGSSSLDSAKTLVVMSDPEGIYQLVEKMIHHSKRSFGNVDFVMAGDMFDPKDASEKKQKDLIDLIAEENMQLVFGNRDLNKLRFLTEASAAFISYLQEIQDDNEQLTYAMMRVHSWALTAKREIQRKTVEQLTELFKGAFGAGNVLEDEAAGKKYLEAVVSNTMGVRSGSYTAEEFGGPKDLSVSAVYKYFSSNENFKKLMTNGKLMHFEPKGCTGDGDCKVLVMHSGIADYEALAAALDLNKNYKPPTTEAKSHAINPYEFYGGVFETSKSLNGKMSNSIAEALKDPAGEGANVVAKLKEEFATVKEIEGYAGQFATANAFFAKFWEQNAISVGYPEIVEAYNLKAEVNAEGSILQFFDQPIGRKAELAIEGSLPFPIRSPLFEKEQPEQAYAFPGATTNLPLLYYLEVQKRFLGDGAKGGEAKAHICDLAQTGVSSVVLGHITLAGPITIKFPAEQINKICELDVEKDLVVAGIDNSGYAAVAKGREKISWSYFYLDGETHSLRFRDHLEDIYDIDFSDKLTGVPLDIGGPEVLAKLRGSLQSGNALPARFQDAEYEGPEVEAIYHAIDAIVKKSTDVKNDPVTYFVLQAAKRVGDDAPALFLHGLVNVGEPWNGSQFFKLHLTPEDVRKIRE